MCLPATVLILTYGREVVHVEMDHKRLESIVLKPLNSALTRLQQILLKLQRYSLNVKYKRVGKMFLADTLSRAYLPDISVCEFSRRLEDIDHTISLAIDDERLQQIKHWSTDDAVLQVLCETIQRGWPERKSDIPE